MMPYIYILLDELRDFSPVPSLPYSYYLHAWQYLGNLCVVFSNTFDIHGLLPTSAMATYSATVVLNVTLFRVLENQVTEDPPQKIAAPYMELRSFTFWA